MLVLHLESNILLASLSKSTKKSPSKGDAADGGATEAITCVLCHDRVSPNDMAILTCGMPSNAHQSSVHVSCAKKHGIEAACNFLKTERLHKICRLLGGGGANPNLVSNTTLKELGLQDMLDGTGAEKRKGSLSTVYTVCENFKHTGTYIPNS